MSTQTTDELLAEVAEVRRPQPGDTWVDKVLLWFLGKLEKRLRTAREHTKRLERERDQLIAHRHELQAESHQLKAELEAHLKFLQASCDEQQIEHLDVRDPRKTMSEK